jgi:23S rRNA (adenine2503-C2)-methyltransferase
LAARTDKRNLLGLPQRDLEAYFSEIGEKPYHARQVMQWLYHRGETDIDAMTDLSKSLRQQLIEAAVIELPKVLSQHDSADGTIKWLFSSGSGQAVEAVFIPEPERGTLCISSQVGCALDCAFCATGAQGFNRNLTKAEIIGQVWHANQVLPRRDNGEFAVSNVVLMGMGEPLANYRNVVPALEVLISDLGFGLSRRKVTVSTSGIVPHIDRLGDECNVSLAVSLHAPNNSLRNELVPINKIHPIEQLLDACWRYAKKRANRFITFEYVMLRGVNDSPELADELIGLLEGKPAKVNLIPFNPFNGTEFSRSAADTIAQFQSRLRKSGLVTTTRRTRGDDINAACGQLAGKVSDRVRNRLSEKKLRMATA